MIVMHVFGSLICMCVHVCVVGAGVEQTEAMR